MSEPFIGEVCALPYSFSPYLWAYCSGQELSIAQNQALYAVIGTAFGGNGTSTFGLPRLQAAVAPMGAGSGPGLTRRSLGGTYGEFSVQLRPEQIPSHTHASKFALGHSAAPQADPRGNYLGGLFEVVSGKDHPHAIYENKSQPNVNFSQTTLLPAGGNGAHENQQPFLALNFCIALMGEFPARN